MLAFQFMAWWERSRLPLVRGVLPQSGVLSEMAGLEVLRKPPDFFSDHLEPESYFDDRLVAMPAAPKPLPRPRMRFRFPPDTLAGELERRNAPEWDLKARAAYESRQREIEACERDARTFPERLAKARRHRQWMKDRVRLDTARGLLASWEAKLAEAERLPGWEHLCRRPKAELRGMMATGDPRIVRFCHYGDRPLGPWLKEHLACG